MTRKPDVGWTPFFAPKADNSIRAVGSLSHFFFLLLVFFFPWKLGSFSPENYIHFLSSHVLYGCILEILSGCSQTSRKSRRHPDNLTSGSRQTCGRITRFLDGQLQGKRISVNLRRLGGWWRGRICALNPSDSLLTP